MAHELGLDGRVFFLGYIPQPPSPDLPQLYNCTDALVLGSFHESLALVLAEALACGKPVISTPVGIAPQVIQDGVTGYLVQSREPAEMSIRMRQVLGSVEFDPSTCVKAARKYAGASEQICDVIEKMSSVRRNLG